MSSFNSSNRRSMDGPIKRPAPMSVPGFSHPLEAAGVSDVPVVSAPVVAPIRALPEEPTFVYKKPAKVRTGIGKAARWVALGILIMALGIGGWFGYHALVAAHSIFAKAQGTGAPALSGNINLTELKGEGDGRVNILVLGIGGQGHDAPNLSDTMMVISIDPKTKDAAMLSVPRDLYVKIPATDKTNAQYGKINAANALGGPELAARVVSNVIGVPIHYYVLVDFSGFRQAVDAVGGVDINVPKAIYDPQYPCDDERGGYCPFRISAGMQHMNGTVALRYSRSRHSTSDFDRAARQQMVIAALKQKAMQLSTLTNPVKLIGLIDALGSHVKTDIQPNELTKLAAIAKDIDTSKTPSKVIDTDSANALLIGGMNIYPQAGYVEVPKAGNFNYIDIQDMVKNIFVDHYIVDENARLEVQNGSGIPGAASALVKSLQAAHYNVGDPLNAPDHYTQTTIYDYTGGKKPYTINYLEQRFKVKAVKAPAPTPAVDANGQPIDPPQIRIIIGSDYKPVTTTSSSN